MRHRTVCDDCGCDPHCCILSNSPSLRLFVGAEEDPQLQRTLRVSWATACGTYSAEQLRTAFAEFGAVDDVLIREGKKKKGVALVVMADPAIAVRRSATLLISYPTVERYALRVPSVAAPSGEGC